MINIFISQVNMKTTNARDYEVMISKCHVEVVENKWMNKSLPRTTCVYSVKHLLHGNDDSINVMQTVL